MANASRYGGEDCVRGAERSGCGESTGCREETCECRDEIADEKKCAGCGESDGYGKAVEARHPEGRDNASSSSLRATNSPAGKGAGERRALPSPLRSIPELAGCFRRGVQRLARIVSQFTYFSDFTVRRYLTLLT